ncbi:MAG: hypothetical protein PSV22_15995 [Pseudolabrys sp.]|nr:hypothetical protein [Pseudolabrys sp.]
MSRVDHLRAGRHVVDEDAVTVHGDRLHRVALPIVNIRCKLEGALVLDFPAGVWIAGSVQGVTVAVGRCYIQLGVENDRRKIVPIVKETVVEIVIVVIVIVRVVMVVIVPPTVLGYTQLLTLLKSLFSAILFLDPVSAYHMNLTGVTRRFAPDKPALRAVAWARGDKWGAIRLGYWGCLAMACALAYQVPAPRSSRA